MLSGQCSCARGRPDFLSRLSSLRPNSLLKLFIVANGPPQMRCPQLKLQSIIAAEQQNGAVRLTLFTLGRGGGRT